MPVAKLCSSETVNAMTSEEGNDSLDTFIRQAIGKEPLLPFSRTGDNPIQWIQLLHALDQPDIPGWPLFTPLKVQMQKCEKCSREFCSPINYRRHIRVHRRTLHVNKDSHKNRDLLAAFWDKLSLEEAKDVVAFNDVMLKGIPGSSVLRALSDSLRKPGVWTLPPVYVKAGSMLLDIIQAKPCSLPISSQELFSILDDASEMTFLCAGSADSLQRYVFDRETAKNSLELKNLVASTSFLFEQQLVKAWVADKDAEALRCQKLLVEEEEAAQKRQAAILERKRQKKLRKEQKLKDDFYGCSNDLTMTVDEADRPDSADLSGPSSPSDSNSNSQDVPSNLDSFLESFQSKESDADVEPESVFSNENINQGDSQVTELQVRPADGHRHSATTRWQVSRSQRADCYGLRVNQNPQISKTEAVHRYRPYKDRALLNGKKVWTQKFKSDSVVERVKPPVIQEKKVAIESKSLVPVNQWRGESKPPSKCEVIIGSIPVTLRSSVDQKQESRPGEAQDTNGNRKQGVLKKNGFKKQITGQVAFRSILVKDKGKEHEGDTMLEKTHERAQSSENPIQSESIDDDDRDNLKDNGMVLEEHAQQGKVPFSSEAAREFFAQRWKEAIASDHVKLVLTPVPGRSNETTASDVSDRQERSAVGHRDNKVGRSGRAKSRKKPEKSMKIKYIPKQKGAA